MAPRKPAKPRSKATPPRRPPRRKRPSPARAATDRTDRKGAAPKRKAARRAAHGKDPADRPSRKVGKSGKSGKTAAIARAGKAPRSNSRTRLITDERRAQLIALGLELFSSRAYDEVHIAELATVAGISKGLLYHYFPTKRDFYTAALQTAAERLLAQLQPDPQLAPLARLQRGLHRYLSYVQQYGTSYVGLMRGGVGSDPAIAAIVEETRVACMSRLISGMGFSHSTLPALLRIALRAWIGAVEAASLEWVLCPDVPADEVVGLLSQQLLHILLSLGAMPAM